MNAFPSADVRTPKPTGPLTRKSVLPLGVTQACLCCLPSLMICGYALADLSEQELAQLRQKAEQGDAEAQYQLAVELDKQNKSGEAIKWALRPVSSKKGETCNVSR